MDNHYLGVTTGRSEQPRQPRRKEGKQKVRKNLSVGEITALKKVLSFEEAKAILNIEDKALRQRIYRCQVPYKRWGGRIVFFRDELEQFLATLPGVSVQEAVARVENIAQ